MTVWNIRCLNKRYRNDAIQNGAPTPALRKHRKVGARWVARGALGLLLLGLFGGAHAQTADLTDAWSDVGGGQWQSTTTNGITVTASAVTTAPAAWLGVVTGPMALDDIGVPVFSNPDVYGRSSLRAFYFWDMVNEAPHTDIDLLGDDQRSGTITFTFSKVVKDPILFLDRLGGNGTDNGIVISTSAQFTLNGGLTWVKLLGTTSFESTGTTIQRAPDVALTNPASAACINDNSGTSCGTVQIIGEIESFSLTWAGVGVEGPGGDALAIVIEARPLDYGDAPQSYDGNAASAARHVISSDLYLGDIIADGDGRPPPWAPALGLPDGDDTDAEGDDEDGVDGTSMETYAISGINSATLDILKVTNNTASDAQLVCWIDWGEDGTFSDTSGNNGAGDPNERTHPELIAHTLTRTDPDTPAVDHYASVITSSTAVTASMDHYALAVTFDDDAADETFALGAPDGSVAILDKNDVFTLDMGVAGTIPSGATFTVWAQGDGDAKADSVDVETSPDNATWTAATPATLDRLAVGITTTDFTAGAIARYIRFTRTADQIQIDAVRYQEAGSGVLNPTDALNTTDALVATMQATNDEIILDMGDAGTIPSGSTFTITARGGDLGTGTATVETSLDNITYASAGSITDPGTVLTGIGFVAPNTARYVRITLTSGAGDEEIRIDSAHYLEPAVPGSSVACTDIGITDGTYTTGNVPAGCQGTATVFWSNIPTLPAEDEMVYSRCRLTTDGNADSTFFFSDSSPTATGAAADGEVEDDELPEPDPTAVTIGKVSLEGVSVSDYLAQADVNQLQALLTSFGTIGTADGGATDGVDKAALIAELAALLDPDGDGQVAVLRWDTLAERGTIGFYAERRDEDDNWIRINNDLLPGLITAPMGAEYLLADPAAQSGQTYQYRLIELEATGYTRQYGPFTLVLR